MSRILIADDNALVRRYIHEVLEDDTGWQVCGEAATGAEAVRMAGDLKPDAVVLDVSMPELNGLEAAARIHKLFPETEILIVSMYDAPELIEAAFASGARAYLLKHKLDELIATVRSVLKAPIS
jgi:DNA-binding NarL/FixJ family response regulator